MLIKKDKIILESSEYENLINIHNELVEKLYNCRKENNILCNKLGKEKRKSYRNRKLFESFIDEVVLPIVDEDMLKKLTNLTYKTFKEVIMKEYDKDIK